MGVARFESREAAMRNSERPEQGDWWERCSKLFTGDVTFHDCSRVTRRAWAAPTTPGSSR